MCINIVIRFLGVHLKVAFIALQDNTHIFVHVNNTFLLDELLRFRKSDFMHFQERYSFTNVYFSILRTAIFHDFYALVAATKYNLFVVSALKLHTLSKT